MHDSHKSRIELLLFDLLQGMGGFFFFVLSLFFMILTTAYLPPNYFLPFFPLPFIN